MSRPQDFDPRSIEDDPTGMRVLLSSLPDPGPMPDDLVARIAASLSAEQLPSHSLDELAGRRRARHLLLAAAAAAAVVAGGGALLHAGLPGSVVASFGTTSASGASQAEGSLDGGDTKAAPGSADGLSQALPGTVVLRTGTAYQAADLATGAMALDPTLDRAAARAVAPGAPRPSGADGALASPLGARACATALGVPTADAVVVDIATVDGRPAAVVVARSTSGVQTAYAVGLGCRSGATALITGPVPVR